MDLTSFFVCVQHSFLLKADDHQFIQGLQLFESLACSYCR